MKDKQKELSDKELLESLAFVSSESSAFLKRESLFDGNIVDLAFKARDLARTLKADLNPVREYRAASIDGGDSGKFSLSEIPPFTAVFRSFLGGEPQLQRNSLYALIDQSRVYSVQYRVRDRVHLAGYLFVLEGSESPVLLSMNTEPLSREQDQLILALLAALYQASGLLIPDPEENFAVFVSPSGEELLSSMENQPIPLELPGEWDAVQSYEIPGPDYYSGRGSLEKGIYVSLSPEVINLASKVQISSSGKEGQMNTEEVPFHNRVILAYQYFLKSGDWTLPAELFGLTREQIIKAEILRDFIAYDRLEKEQFPEFTALYHMPLRNFEGLASPVRARIFYDYYTSFKEQFDAKEWEEYVLLTWTHLFEDFSMGMFGDYTHSQQADLLLNLPDKWIPDYWKAVEYYLFDKDKNAFHRELFYKYCPRFVSAETLTALFHFFKEHPDAYTGLVSKEKEWMDLTGRISALNLS